MGFPVGPKAFQTEFAIGAARDGITQLPAVNCISNRVVLKFWLAAGPGRQMWKVMPSWSW